MADKLKFRSARSATESIPNSVPTPSGAGKNRNVKGVEAVYDRNPTIPNFPHSMSESTLPIKFAEKEMTAPKNVQRSAGVTKAVDRLKSGRGAVPVSSNQTRSARSKSK